MINIILKDGKTVVIPFGNYIAVSDGELREVLQSGQVGKTIKLENIIGIREHIK